MQKLNLPTIDCKITESDGKTLIFDPIRKKYLVLTPEEWVRQHVIHLLVHQLHFSKNLLKQEGGLKYHELDKRSDILIYTTTGKPYFLIECKAPEVPISTKTIEQVTRYNKVLSAPYFAVTNGLKTYCFEVQANGLAKQMNGFPTVPAE